jgi:hypothetical protein
MNAILDAAAQSLISRAREYKARKIYLSILDDARTPKVSWMWKHKNMFGVSFEWSEVELAKDWIIKAIEAGYRFWKPIKATWFFLNR